MRRINLTVLFMAIFIQFIMYEGSAQESFYGLKSVKKIATSPTKDLQRSGSCWSNAGAAFLEAEMLKGGKKDINLSEMDFIHNAYLQKADFFLKNNGKIRVGGNGLASDVIKSMNEFGMVPESGYMKSDKDAFSEETSEMDAILQGTLRMILDKEKGVFSDRWRNIYNGALLNYIGEARINFNSNSEDFTPKTFGEKSGLKATDYVLISSDSRQEMYKPFVLQMKNNWSDEKAYNVTPEDMVKVTKGAVEKGFTVTWCGDVVQKTIYVKENVAIIPASKMPGEKTNETDQLVMEPVAEKIILSTERQEKYQTILNNDLGYMLVYAMSKDKKGTDYLVAKNVCQSGDNTLNLSEAYFKLNTVFLLINKNALPAELKTKLGL